MKFFQEWLQPCLLCNPMPFVSYYNPGQDNETKEIKDLTVLKPHHVLNCHSPQYTFKKYINWDNQNSFTTWQTIRNLLEPKWKWWNISRTFHKEKIAKLLPKNKARTASQNTIRQMTSAMWRISAELNIPLYPELAVKQANEDAKLTSIMVISTLNKHMEVKNSTLVFMSSTFMLSIEILISTFFSLLPFKPTSLFLIWFANFQKRTKFKTMLQCCIK